jgi:hypothetical protein
MGTGPHKLTQKLSQSKLLKNSRNWYSTCRCKRNIHALFENKNINSNFVCSVLLWCVFGCAFVSYYATFEVRMGYSDVIIKQQVAVVVVSA